MTPRAEGKMFSGRDKFFKTGFEHGQRILLLLLLFSFTDDGICVACKMPADYVTIVENYCLADFGKMPVLS